MGVKEVIYVNTRPEVHNHSSSSRDPLLAESMCRESTYNTPEMAPEAFARSPPSLSNHPLVYFTDENLNNREVRYTCQAHKIASTIVRNQTQI